MKYNPLFSKENLIYSALCESRNPDGTGGTTDTGGSGGTEDPDETPSTEIPGG